MIVAINETSAIFRHVILTSVARDAILETGLLRRALRTPIHHSIRDQPIAVAESHVDVAVAISMAILACEAGTSTTSAIAITMRATALLIVHTARVVVLENPYGEKETHEMSVTSKGEIVRTEGMCKGSTTRT